MAITDDTKSQVAMKLALKGIHAERKQRIKEDRIKKNELRDAKAEAHWAALDKIIEEKLVGASALKAYESWQTCMGNVLEAAWEMHKALKEAKPLPRIAQSIVNVPKYFNDKAGLTEWIANTGRRGLAALYLVDPKLETLPNLRAMVKVDGGKLDIHVSAFKEGKELPIPLGDAAKEMQNEIAVGAELYLRSEGFVPDNNGSYSKDGELLTQDDFDNMLTQSGGLLAKMLSDETGLAVEATPTPRM